VLSTAPRWAAGPHDQHEWRDHWMQAVYFLPQVRWGVGNILETAPSFPKWLLIS
jgi:hypothetical protein